MSFARLEDIIRAGHLAVTWPTNTKLKAFAGCASKKTIVVSK